MAFKVSVAIITPSLGNGGAERVSSLVSVFLTDLGYDVTLFAAYPNKDFHFKGSYFYLGHSKSNLFPFFSLVRSFFKLYKAVKSGSFDFVIDFRSRRIFWIELMFQFFIYSNVKNYIFTIHLPLIDKYIPKPWFLFQNFYKKANALVSVSDAISAKVNDLGYANQVVIKNPIDFELIDIKKEKQITIEAPYILAAGRMDDNIKRFNHVIRAYVKSKLPVNGIHLVILGEGVIKPQLQALCHELKCEHMISFLGFQQNPFNYFANARFFVLASEFEGFPMVLIEALACGTPVVSYDCPTGPSEIVHHQKNGLVVENGNINALSEAISRMHEDKALYKTCKENTRKSVAHLSFENIKDQWRQLIESAIP
jgi:N-acetylgalactosamine-N,N'-diacetylbacillosaminyl-diphospho-undecaprenol 4-alpha-N-acetylgalactosaminyltransferase